MAARGSAKARGRKPLDFRRRSSGLLLHVTSLPGRHGSGDLGAEALRFVDFCADAGQTWWQMLPVGPPGAPPWNSPYSSHSSAAGSPFLVSLDVLARDGLLTPRELRRPAGADDARVSFESVNAFREERLRVAHERFCDPAFSRRNRRLLRDYLLFQGENRAWLEDFALFCALKERSGGAPWSQWDARVRRREPEALERARHGIGNRLDYHRFVQFLFDRQWQALRAHARHRGVGLIGDVPIYVIHDSVDVWCDPELFTLDRTGRPTRVSGVPPDAFSADGQRWGHPQYDWAAHRRQKFRWWVARFERTFRLFDAVRIDHFLGFNRVWSIPAASPTARWGRWVRSPGRELFETLRRHLGERPIIAEDLGVLTPQAAALRDHFGFPGMRVFHFGFGGGDDYHRPHAYPHASVAYTGTHDNDTTVGWFDTLGPPSSRRDVLAYTGGTPRAIHRDAIRAVMVSAANTVIFPVQDLLGLDGRARMNTPGTAGGNWGWRVPAGALTRALATELRRLAGLSGRA
jgi:4-alpha-glucanotransferase